MTAVTECLTTVLAAVWSVWAAVGDWRHRRIPNTLIIAGAVLALASASLFGVDAVLSALLSGGIAAAFLLIPYFVRATGAGDVKMMFVAGVFAGPGRALSLICATAFCGFVLALGLLAFKAVNSARLRHYVRCAFDPRYDRAAGRAALPLRDDESCRVPFGAAIAVGLVLVRFAALAEGGVP